MLSGALTCMRCEAEKRKVGSYRCNRQKKNNNPGGGSQGWIRGLGSTSNTQRAGCHQGWRDGFGLGGTQHARQEPAAFPIVVPAPCEAGRRKAAVDTAVSGGVVGWPCEQRARNRLLSAGPGSRYQPSREAHRAATKSSHRSPA